MFEADYDGGWSEWTEWLTGADGQQTRTRACAEPNPVGNGAPCVGEAIETQGIQYFMPLSLIEVIAE